ncbi:RNA-directed RNA polymerase [Diaporthe helianthi]|uniref:RNA-dependent RNA polymerase n=1 Tax=Diaporthe helianthi TaxID=158607 RepID=A0A2P5I317_DIAHE|nr:RNA-directed RNA polymerase [Diaporthe helianthi]
MGVELGSVSLTYDAQWKDQTALRSALGDAFPGKSMPPAPESDAWTEATNCTPGKDKHVVFVASLEFPPMQSSSPLRLRLQPPKLDKPHRLGRTYGPDRFLELLVPSPDPSNLPSSLKDKPFYDHLLDWLTSKPHAFCGRLYRPFYLKSGGQRKPPKQLLFGPDPKPTYMDRIFLFDISGNDRPSTPLGSMVSWALDLKGGNNGSQPVLKLFQRLALVLSRTIPTIVFESGQIRHRTQDLLSNGGKKVMNDGVGRMSRKVAKMIQSALGLSSPPCAVQGRLGSAKGMWTVDSTDTTDDIWIETYPSQRKWELEAADQEHRTLEIRSCAPEKLRSASLNLQFLPVLEDRAIDKPRMRETVGKLLGDSLRQQLSDQRQSLEDPIQFQKWVSSNAAHRSDRLARGHILFQGGLPREDEEIMAFMLNAGFDPRQNKFLNKKAYDAQLQMCEKHSKKLNIKIGRSAYFFMVVDFQDLLEEGEVHIAFSDRFRSETDDWEGTMVHGVDVLVARSPAHFPSDIQRVKAVFKPELAHLQNVIVFSARGETPLADKLSGGDYDGDQCFCVWDDRLVENFANAHDEAQPDLRSYYRKDSIKFHQLLSTHNQDYEAAIGEMVEKCFAFNLSKDMLGQVTNYKERLCYHRGNVHDDVAMKLSTLLSILVDAPKQGIEFNSNDFKAFRRSLGIPDQHQLDEPWYKTTNQPSNQQYGHILDYLKFNIAKPIIDKELATFERDYAAHTVYWDKDLTAKSHDEFELEAKNNDVKQSILSCLKEDIERVSEEWKALSGTDAVSFGGMVLRTYNSWLDIKPRAKQDIPEETLQCLLHRGYPRTSRWALLRASTTFKLYYQKKPLFAWHVAGWHLRYIKWQAASEKKPEDSMGRMPAMLTWRMHTITKVDTRAVNQLMELQKSTGVEVDQAEDEDVL